ITFELRQLAPDGLTKLFLHHVGARARRIKQRPPSLHRQPVAPRHAEIGSGEMQLGKRIANRRAVRSIGPPDPHAVEKRKDRCRTVSNTPERLAAAPAHRLRTVKPTRRQMLDEIKKERQIADRNALFVKGENKKTFGRV